MISHAVVGNLVEVDKSKQLLYVVRKGQVMWAINTSTGSGQRYSATSKITGKDASGVAVTPNGMHTVYRQEPNGWHSGDLGTIYRPKYFAGGAAIHGFNRIPAYPASHGCVRVSTAFMDYVWAANLVPLKSTVWVHDVARRDPAHPSGRRRADAVLMARHGPLRFGRASLCALELALPSAPASLLLRHS